MSCPETTAIGAYVLGALGVEERRATEQHLTTCDSCRETLLQFAPLPGLLHTVPLEDVQADEPEPTPPLRLPVRRTPRRALLAAAAILIAAITGLLSWQAFDDPPQAITWTATDGVDGIDTTAKLTGQPWGTDIRLHLADLRPGEHCRLVIHADNGDTETSGWWATTSTYQADVPASTSIPLTDIDRLEVVTSTDQILSTLTRESR